MKKILSIITNNEPLINRWIRFVLYAAISFSIVVWMGYFLQNPGPISLFSTDKKPQKHERNLSTFYQSVTTHPIKQQEPYVPYLDNSNHVLKTRFDSPSNKNKVHIYKQSSFESTSNNNGHMFPILGSNTQLFATIILLCFICAIPKIPSIRINCQHLRYFLQIPPSWLGALLGWAFGARVIYSQFNEPGMILIFLIWIPIILVIKNWHNKTIEPQKNAHANRPDPLFTTLDKEYKSHATITQENSKKLFATTRDWFSVEQTVDDYTHDLSGTLAFSKKIANNLADEIRAKKFINLGVIGSYGSGKSSLINLILNHFNQTKIRTIVCKISMWGCRSSSAAQEFILENILLEIAYRLDTSSIDLLPQEWRKLLAGSGTWWSKAAQLLSSSQSFDRSIANLMQLLKNSDHHLLVVVEDIDRPTDPEYDSKQVQNLLHRLKSSNDINDPRCSFIVAGKAESIDFSRLCERLAEPLKIPVFTFKKLLWITVSNHLPDWEGFRKPDMIEHSLFFGYENSKHSYGDSATSLEAFTLIDFQKLIQTPRTLKHFLRRLDSGWQELRGEIDYWDFFLIILLRTALPKAFDFVHAHHDVFRSIVARNLADEAKDDSTSLTNNIVNEYSELLKTEEVSPNKIAFNKILRILFRNSLDRVLGLDKAKVSEWPSSNVQRVSAKHYPTDYWVRAYMECLNPNEVSDTTITAMHQKWISGENDISEIVKFLDDENVDCKWASLKLELSDQEILKLTSELILRRCVNEEAQVRALNLGLGGAMTTESGFTLLRKKASDRFENNHETYASWVIYMVDRLCKKNLMACLDFILTWVLDKKFATVFPKEQYDPLKVHLVKSFQSCLISLNGSNVAFMKLIPEDCPEFISVYLNVLNKLTETNDENMSNNTSKELGQLLYRAIENKTTESLAMHIVVCALCKERNDKIQNFLDKDLLESLFPEHKVSVMQRISNFDFSTTPFSSSAKKIQNEVLAWIREQGIK